MVSTATIGMGVQRSEWKIIQLQKEIAEPEPEE